jgi:amino acid transporter
MKRTIFTFGTIVGLVVGVFIVFITWLEGNSHHVGNYVIGYSAQVIAFAFIFVGVKNFRDKYNDGVISFGKAFKIGLGIAAIGATLYVLIWLVDFYGFNPDFMDKYAAHMVKEVQDSGVTGAALEKKMAQINGMKEMYKSPLFVVLFTYAEVLPVAIAISLISALILKRRQVKPAVRQVMA